MHGNDRASLGVVQGVVMVFHLVAEMLGHRVELVVFQVGKIPLGTLMGTIEPIIGIRYFVQFVKRL